MIFEFNGPERNVAVPESKRHASKRRICPPSRKKIPIPAASEKWGGRKSAGGGASAGQSHAPANQRSVQAGYLRTGLIATGAFLGGLLTLAVIGVTKPGPDGNSTAPHLPQMQPPVARQAPASLPPQSKAPEAKQALAVLSPAAGELPRAAAVQPAVANEPAGGAHSMEFGAGHGDVSRQPARSSPPSALPSPSAPSSPASLPAEQTPLANLMNAKDTKGARLDDDSEAATLKPKNPDGARAPGKPAANAPAKQAAVPAQAARSLPVCPACLGIEIVPLFHSKPYVHIGVEKFDPAESLPWRYCPKCQAGNDANALLEAEKTRLLTVAATHQNWEQLTNCKLVYAETRHIAIRSTMPEADIRGIAQAIEALSGQLEWITQSTVLSQTRPDSDEMLIAMDQPGYAAFNGALTQQSPSLDLSKVANASSYRLPHKVVMNANRGLGAFKNMALYRFSELAILSATDYKAPAWLLQGFASYCEYLAMKKNAVDLFAFDKNERLSENWNNDIHRYGSQGKLKSWEHVFNRPPNGFSAMDCLTSYSMVSFMMNTAPTQFPKFVLAIKSGLDSKTAFERTYNSDLASLQGIWGKWAVAY